MKHFFLLFLLTFSLSAKTLTPNDVFQLSTLMQQHIHALLKHYEIEHHHDEIVARDKILNTQIQPRNTWQKTYEILVKINMLRIKYNLPRIVPVGIEARLELNPDMVYEMNMRILTELKILEIRNNIKVKDFKLQTFKNKTPLDNYNIYIDVSAGLDELNEQNLTPSYVFAETMRVYDDITIVLNYLGVHDGTMPDSILKNASPRDALKTSFKVLKRLSQLQREAGIEVIDFSEFQREVVHPSEVYTLVGIILAELQTIKAYIGLTRSVTPPARAYTGKKPQNVQQLMRWNLKRLNQIGKLTKGGE